MPAKKKTTEIKTLAELKAKVKLLDLTNHEQIKKVVCSLIGHSRIQNACFGYFYCGRCGDQLGDTLGSSYNAKTVVIVDHNCPTCRANYKNFCTWRDKYLVPDPFAKKK